MATYEFIIKNESSDVVKSPTAPQATPKKSKAPSNEGISPRKAAIASYGIAKQIINSVYTHQVNTTELRTGNSEYQQRLQFHKDLMDRAFNLGESLVAGFMLGGGVGALIGAATSVTMMGVQIAQKADRIATQQSVENISIGLADVRAGAMGDRQGRNV
jgi:hypothetical protein